MKLEKCIGVTWDETEPYGKGLRLVDDNGGVIPGVISVSISEAIDEPAVATATFYVRKIGK